MLLLEFVKNWGSEKVGWNSCSCRKLSKQDCGPAKVKTVIEPLTSDFNSLAGAGSSFLCKQFPIYSNSTKKI